MDPETLLLDIVKYVKEFHNLNREDPIPTSDIMLRKLLQHKGLNRTEMDFYMQLLADANQLFILRIVEADKSTGEPELNGYVYADMALVNDMGRLYDNKLESLYEYEMYRRKDALGIIKELVPRFKIYEHTEMGKVLNIDLMLKQYQHVIGENYWQYKPEKKTEKLKEVLKENAHLFTTSHNVSGDETGEEKSQPEQTQSAPHTEFPGSVNIQGDSERALDTNEYRRLQEMNLTGKWGAAVSAYGVQFLLRVHFRKYEFHVVRRLIIARRVARQEDLEYIKTSVETMMRNIRKDRLLRDHLEEMQGLYNLSLERLEELERARVGVG